MLVGATRDDNYQHYKTVVAEAATTRGTKIITAPSPPLLLQHTG